MLDIRVRVGFSAAKIALFASKVCIFGHPKLNISVKYARHRAGFSAAKIALFASKVCIF